MVGRGTELPPPPTLLNEFNWEQQSKRALGGVRVACIRSMLWRVFVARYMACIRGTLLMIIPEEPEYMRVLNASMGERVIAAPCLL